MELGIGGFVSSAFLKSDGNLLEKVVLTALTAPLVIDGLADIFRGTHHYLPMYLWSKLTSSEEARAELESDLRRQRYKIKTNPKLRLISKEEIKK